MGTDISEGGNLLNRGILWFSKDYRAAVGRVTLSLCAITFARFAAAAELTIHDAYVIGNRPPLPKNSHPVVSAGVPRGSSRLIAVADNPDKAPPPAAFWENTRDRPRSYLRSTRSVSSSWGKEGNAVTTRRNPWGGESGVRRKYYCEGSVCTYRWIWREESSSEVLWKVNIATCFRSGDI